MMVNNVQPEPCQCVKSGWCQRMHRYVRSIVVARCQEFPDYRARLDQEAKWLRPPFPFHVQKTVMNEQIRRPMRYGVVIGSYGYPKLIELQIALINRHCGPIPIYVVDDCSPGFGSKVAPNSKFAELKKVCDQSNVLLRPTGIERIGHAGGDIAVFWHGLQWASLAGIDVLAKLSQRFLIDVPHWLQEGAVELMANGLPMACQNCLDGGYPFELRTEACLLNVEYWDRADVINELFPRKLGTCAETVMWNVLSSKLEGKFHKWSLLSIDRRAKKEGVVWHCANTIEDYRSLASRFNLQLDNDFTTSGWAASNDYNFG